MPLPTETFPETLRTVLAYIDANAGRGISIADLAAKAFATPRTIQYLFRRHLGTTPSAHLRRVRLAKARQELILADRSTTTVTATATRWGFGHTGRFAVLYREVYGESPHQTLARRGARSGDRGVVGVEHPVAKAGQ
ncbi:helix-turn-helix transcriptional regulator [Mycobacterium sp. ITM-2016-00317]|uniref:helix-turn-helix transcriptional regulator n=1 Tax=Mycobacterium sp. ITM-2016-00317 TaxID=2099694 RepID=UPI00287FCACF|nr:helix-turn-helix transcriptional regulator [Mycobacterium sp. ITM-2016-00317]WNG90130.1 helix-turn-helix transcriptional regulator [Mycobacterium sp. ITM-2016-00317]